MVPYSELLCDPQISSALALGMSVDQLLPTAARVNADTLLAKLSEVAPLLPSPTGDFDVPVTLRVYGGAEEANFKMYAQRKALPLLPQAESSVRDELSQFFLARTGRAPHGSDVHYPVLASTPEEKKKRAPTVDLTRETAESADVEMADDQLEETFQGITMKLEELSRVVPRQHVHIVGELASLYQTLTKIVWADSLTDMD